MNMYSYFVFEKNVMLTYWYKNEIMKRIFNITTCFSFCLSFNFVLLNLYWSHFLMFLTTEAAAITNDLMSWISMENWKVLLLQENPLSWTQRPQLLILSTLIYSVTSNKLLKLNWPHKLSKRWVLIIERKPYFNINSFEN